MNQRIKNFSQSFLKTTTKLWLFFIDLILPIECLACGQEGTWLCEVCFSQIAINQPTGCFICQKPEPFGRTCSDCLDDYYLNGVLAATDYEQPIVARLIKTMKYKFAKTINHDLAKLIISFLRPLWLIRTTLDNPPWINNANETIVLPVPLHPKRLRWRGFNQAEELAKEVAEYFRFDLVVKNLVRIKNNPPQAKLDGASRLTNVEACFMVKDKLIVAGRQIILVDDVMTTGATLRECAKVLKQAGAKEVWALVVAKG